MTNSRYFEGYLDGSRDSVTGLSAKRFTIEERRIFGGAYIRGYDDGYIEHYWVQTDEQEIQKIQQSQEKEVQIYQEDQSCQKTHVAEICFTS